YLHLLSYYLAFFFVLIQLTPISTLFPYTTLFRSNRGEVMKKETVILQKELLYPVADTIVRLIAYIIDLIVLWSIRQIAIIPILTDRKSTRLNSSHVSISYAVFCLKKKKKQNLTKK